MLATASTTVSDVVVPRPPMPAVTRLCGRGVFLLLLLAAPITTASQPPLRMARRSSMARERNVCEQLTNWSFCQTVPFSTSTRKVAQSLNAPTAGQPASLALPTSSAIAARRQTNAPTCNQLLRGTRVSSPDHSSWQGKSRLASNELVALTAISHQKPAAATTEVAAPAHP